MFLGFEFLGIMVFLGLFIKVINLLSDTFNLTSDFSLNMSLYLRSGNEINDGISYNMRFILHDIFIVYDHFEEFLTFIDIFFRIFD